MSVHGLVSTHLHKSFEPCDKQCPAYEAVEAVDHPLHYNKHPSGVECIDVVEHFGFNLGNAIKYLWRADHKGATKQDLDKAIWYINREIKRRGLDESS